jgi:cobalamin biosynthesis protein CbiD
MTQSMLHDTRFRVNYIETWTAGTTATAAASASTRTFLAAVAESGA